MTPPQRSTAAAVAGAIAGAIMGPIALLAAVMIVGRLLPFNEATGSAAFALLFYLVPAACLVGAVVGWTRFRPPPAERADASTAALRLPPSRGRTVAAGFVGAVLGVIAIDLIAGAWRSSAGDAGGQGVYMAILLVGTPAAIVVGAIAGVRAARGGTGAAPE